MTLKEEIKIGVVWNYMPYSEQRFERCTLLIFQEQEMAPSVVCNAVPST